MDIEDQFKKYLTRLIKDADMALSSYGVLKYLNTLEPEKFEIINISPFFWDAIMNALDTDFIISTSKLFDINTKLIKSRSDVNILSVLEFAINNFDILFSSENVKKRYGILSEDDWRNERIHWLNLDDVKKDLAFVHSLLSKISNILYYRDKSYAHLDNEFVLLPKEQREKNKITYNEIEKLVEDIYELLNKYNVAFDGSKYIFKARNLNDADKTINILYNYLTDKKNKRS